MLAEVPAGVFLVIVGFFVAMSGIILFAGITARKRAKLVKATPTSPLGMATDGYREFEGRIEPVPGPAVTAPLTGWPCAWYDAKIEQFRSGSGQRSTTTWHTVKSWTSNAPFFVRDASGVAIVDPYRAEVTPTDKSQWYGKTEQPTDRNPEKVGPTQSPHHGVEIAVTGQYRYSEQRIYAGDPLLILGEYGTHTFDAADDDEPDDGAPDTTDIDAADARDDALLAEAHKVTRAMISRGSGKQPFLMTTTSQAQHIAMNEKGGIAAYVVALVPLAVAVLLLWARFG